MRAALDNQPLTRTPFLLAHDAASGYLGDSLVDRWAKTQSGGLRQQLDCGIRAFDARPLKTADDLVWHHGKVRISYPFARTLTDIVAWAEEHPSELILL